MTAFILISSGAKDDGLAPARLVLASACRSIAVQYSRSTKTRSNPNVFQRFPFFSFSKRKERNSRTSDGRGGRRREKKRKNGSIVRRFSTVNFLLNRSPQYEVPSSVSLLSLSLSLLSSLSFRADRSPILDAKDTQR